MKKLTKVSALLLLAAVFFTGCKEPEDSIPDVDVSPLFSVSETTVEISGSAIVLADGTWGYKHVDVYLNSCHVEECEITVTNGEPKATRGTSTVKGTFPDNVTDEQIESAKASVESEGGTFRREGNTFYYSGNMDEEYLNDIEDTLAEFITSSITLKTNDDRTKYYYYSEEENPAGGIVTRADYLMKK